jgi:hypothetical protein
LRLIHGRRIASETPSQTTLEDGYE